MATQFSTLSSIGSRALHSIHGALAVHEIAMRQDARRTPKRHSHCALDLTRKALLLDRNLKSLFDFGGIPFLGSEFASLAAIDLINFTITNTKYAPE